MIGFEMERATGIQPVRRSWQDRTLALDNARVAPALRIERRKRASKTRGLPLTDTGKMARADGIKPPQTGSEPVILSLNEARIKVAGQERFELSPPSVTAKCTASYTTDQQLGAVYGNQTRVRLLERQPGESTPLIPRGRVGEIRTHA